MQFSCKNGIFFGELVWEVIHDLNTGCTCDGCFGLLIKDEYGGGYVLSTIDWDGIQDGPDFHIIKLDENGQEIWRQTHGNYNVIDIPLAIAQTSDGGYIIGGLSRPNGYDDLVNQNSEIYVMRLNDMGGFFMGRLHGKYWNQYLGTNKK